MTGTKRELADAVIDCDDVTIGVATLADFARTVARACARVADATADSKKIASRCLEPYPMGVRDGHVQAATRIRRAIRRPRGKR